MAKNQKAWSDAQRSAIVTEYLKRQRTLEVIVAAAQAGEILDANGERFPPRRLPRDTAYRWIRQHRDREANRPGPPREEIAKTLEAALRIAREEIEVEAKRPAGKRDVTRVKQITAALKDAEMLRKSLDITPTDTPDETSREKAESEATKLLDAARQRVEGIND